MTRKLRRIAFAAALVCGANLLYAHVSRAQTGEGGGTPCGDGLHLGRRLFQWL